MPHSWLAKRNAWVASTQVLQTAETETAQAGIARVASAGCDVKRQRIVCKRSRDPKKDLKMFPRPLPQNMQGFQGIHNLSLLSLPYAEFITFSSNWSSGHHCKGTYHAFSSLLRSERMREWKNEPRSEQKK